MFQSREQTNDQRPRIGRSVSTIMDALLFVLGDHSLGERLDSDPSGARCGCFLPDLTRLARHLPAPTSHAPI